MHCLFLTSVCIQLKMINLFKIFLKCTYVSYFHHFSNWMWKFWVLFSLSTMIFKIKTELTTRKYMSPYKLGWTFTSMVLKQMNKLPRLPWVVMANWPKACYNAVDSILRLTWVPAARYELQLVLSYDWLKFRRLDTSCGWFYLATDSNSGGWIRVATDSILWLEFWWLDTSHSWFYPAADSSSGWFYFAADSSPGDWMRVAAYSILRLIQIPSAG